MLFIFDHLIITSTFQFICSFPCCPGCCCMLNSTCRECRIRKSFGKITIKLFSKCFKGQTDSAFVFLCKYLWTFLCSSLFSLWILSALTFLLLFLLCVLCGCMFYLKWFLVIFNNNALYSCCFSPKIYFYLTVLAFEMPVHVVVQLEIICLFNNAV